MGTHPTFSPSTGPSASYQPKTTDESDSSVAGGVVPHVNVQGPLIGTLADVATPDIGAAGASFSLISLLKGIAANTFNFLGRVPASLGAKLSAASLSIVPASDAVFPAPVDQDPVFDHANGKKLTVTTSATVLTPPTGCKYVRVSCDADVMVNAAGQTAADDGTSVRIVANAPEVIPVTAGVPVNALSLSGVSAVVRMTPMKVRS